jgi:catechol 2,3-dioxygenase-like lactoylglutathione lyase family enzyme
MTDMTESIEVDVDTHTAFTAFTAELDDWWGDGHIDSWYGYKVVDHRIEPGVGGRVLEVHEDGELELARITVWEPPHRVAWQSSVDDVAIDVRFDELAPDRTKVSVRAEIPTGGADRGGTSFFRMIPQWLPPHLERRAAGISRPSLTRLHVLVRAHQPVALARWLAATIPGLDHGDLPEADGPDAFPWLELRAAGASIVIWKAEEGHELVPTANHEVWVYVDDVDAAFARATANGATIVDPVHEHGYRRFVFQDPEGNRWSLLQARPALRTTTAAPEPAAAR